MLKGMWGDRERAAARHSQPAIGSSTITVMLLWLPPPYSQTEGEKEKG